MKRLGAILLLVLIGPLIGQAGLESQDYVLDQPTFNYGSVSTSSADSDLFGAIGSGGLSDSSNSLTQGGSGQQNVLPTPNTPVVSIKNSQTIRISVEPGSNDPYITLQVEVRRSANNDPALYDTNGQIASGDASWGAAVIWREGVQIGGLKAGERYQIRARAKGEEGSVSEWSGETAVNLSGGLVGGGLLPSAITKPIQNWLQTPVGESVGQIASKLLSPVIVASVVAQAIAVTSLVGQILIDLLLKLIAGLSPLSQFFVFFKRKKPYGRVTDSKTHRPVVGARVALLRADTKAVLDTQITDQDGRYYFTVDERQSFILRIEAPQFDIYERLFRGSAVNRQITLGLALEYDPAQLRRRQRIDRLMVVLNAWRLPLLLIGTAMWLLLYIRDGGFALWLGIYYALAWVLEIVIRTQPSPFGIITDQITHVPLGGAVVRIYNHNGRLILTFVTSANGRFTTLLRSGWYHLTVSRSGYQTSTIPRVLFTRRGTLQAIRFALKPLS